MASLTAVVLTPETRVGAQRWSVSVQQRQVSVSLPRLEEHEGRTRVLVDDIVSTGRTMIDTARHLRRRDLPPPVCLGVHAVFAESSYEELSAVAGRVVTSNTIAHPSNVIDVTPLVARAVEELLGTSDERRGR